LLKRCNALKQVGAAGREAMAPVVVLQAFRSRFPCTDEVKGGKTQ
jgi:hypothetical protein